MVRVYPNDAFLACARGCCLRVDKARGFQEAKELWGGIERYVDGPNGLDRLGTRLWRWLEGPL